MALRSPRAQDVYNLVSKSYRGLRQIRLGSVLRDVEPTFVLDRQFLGRKLKQELEVFNCWPRY